MENNSQQILEDLQRKVKVANNKVRMLDRDMKAQFKKAQQIISWKINNQNAQNSPDKNRWSKEESSMFQKMFKRHHPNNPYVKKSKACENGTMLFVADNEVHFTHVQQLLICLAAFGRYVHINTGTHGRYDGSTVFWVSAHTEHWLLEEDHRQMWLEGAQTFINEDLKTVSQTTAWIFKGDTRISIRMVDTDVYPIQPEFCDTINAWCYSANTPRCPQELMENINYWVSGGASHWDDKSQGTIQEKLKTLTQIAQEAMGRLKVDNIFINLLDACKMLGMPKECIKFARAFFEKNWNKNQQMEAQDCEDIKINDNRWTANLINTTLKFIMEFLVAYYKGHKETQDYINKYSQEGMQIVINDGEATNQMKQRQKRTKPRRRVKEVVVEKKQEVILIDGKDPGMISYHQQPIKRYRVNEFNPHDQPVKPYKQGVKENYKLPEDETKDLIIVFVRSDAKLQGDHPIGSKIIVTQDSKNCFEYFYLLDYQNSPESKKDRAWIEEMKNGCLYLGRNHSPVKNHPFIPLCSQANKMLSRSHLKITYDQENYWMQDLRCNPAMIRLSHLYPMKLQQGMMIQCGPRDASFIIVHELSIEDLNHSTLVGDINQGGDSLHNVFTKQNCRLQNQHPTRRNYLKLTNEELEPLAELWPEYDVNQCIWHLVSEGYSSSYPKKFNAVPSIIIENDKGKHWADIIFEHQVGWYIRSGKKVELEKNVLQIALKNQDEMYDQPPAESHPILIQEDMMFSITKDYVLKCTTRNRPKEEEQSKQSQQQAQLQGQQQSQVQEEQTFGNTVQQSNFGQQQTQIGFKPQQTQLVQQQFKPQKQSYGGQTQPQSLFGYNQEQYEQTHQFGRKNTGQQQQSGQQTSQFGKFKKDDPNDPDNEELC